MPHRRASELRRRTAVDRNDPPGAGESAIDLMGLKICFIIGHLRPGGSERQLFYILKALHDEGARPRVLCLTRGDFWDDKIRNLGILVTWIGEARSRWLRLIRIISELRRNPPEIVQSQHFYTNSYAIAAGRLLGLPDIGAMRSNGIREFNDSGALVGWLNFRAPRVIAVNSQAGIHYARSCGVPDSRLYLLPNVVDTDQFQPATTTGRKVVRVISVGRLVSEKRFDRFISVLAHVRKNSTKPVHATIVGPSDLDRDLRRQLQQQAARLGLGPEALEFRGAVSNMVPVYQEADLCVLTSDFEGTPNVLMEAMACGLPVVATRVGGVPDLVREGETGFTVEPDCEDALGATLLRLVHDDGLRRAMGHQGRAYIVARHSSNCLPVFLRDLYALALS